MYEIEFYYDRNGKSEIIEFLDGLKEKATTSKNERINREKILTYIGALQRYGTRIGMPYVKHIAGDIWELRPLGNRIFFFIGKIISLFSCIILLRKRRKHP